ncbi:MAG: 4-(cytidine 5'-diphospho)-2-C-methyl-D-erythritol kinase [Verrucomicrobia bacterium]|nr:4-(cytidine 5'-diphospho)-2-C-methyl-D-erythritol kinase [Verrucomicrobiota bacterium]MBI3869028.1 4-(cytidine 5'-diphospho)-2-C-methyl-D-erythritol kinase [Verrucomicrobiota bacterium]
MSVERITLESPCKVNWVLNILGSRPDGFHELESLMVPVPICDRLQFDPDPREFALTCSHPGLPVDGSNLVHKAATLFFAAAGLEARGSIHLEKRIPMAAGLGGGSGNAAVALLGLNQVFGKPLPMARLYELAAQLGSDVPFFLESGPALALGRGEKVERLPSFSALRGCALLLVHPGFGISTPWAYQALKRFPNAIHGTPGRAAASAAVMAGSSAARAAEELFNSLEAPALDKYPILSVYQRALQDAGALGALMSGSGSSTFGVFGSIDDAARARQRFVSRFSECWTEVARLSA